MEVKNLGTGKIVITLSEEEKQALLKAIERLSQTFQISVVPAMKQLSAALAAAAPAIRQFNDAAASAREVCQRLDPAFSGPPEEEAFPIRRLDLVTGQSKVVEG